MITSNGNRESIQKTTQLFQAPFFRQFPIIIVACGMDVHDYSIDLEAIFNVKFKSDTRIIENTKSNWYNIHYCIGEQPKLLIHTNQLSMNISNDLLKEVAEICRAYLQPHINKYQRKDQ